MNHRFPVALIIDSAVLANPLLDADSVVDRAAWVADEARKWIKGAQTIVAAPWGDTISDHSLWISARCVGVGVETVRVAPGIPVERARYVWHLVSEFSPNARMPLRADRMRQFVVPMDSDPPWDAVHAEIVQYAALMAFPRAGE